MLVACLGLLGAAVVCSPRRTEAQPGPTGVASGVVKGPVYFGNPQSYKKPAELSIAKVWAALPEYKEIEKGNIRDDDPRYWILMQKANRRLEHALKAMNKKYGYDLIGELKFLDTEAEVPDITAEMILEIKKKKRRKGRSRFAHSRRWFERGMVSSEAIPVVFPHICSSVLTPNSLSPVLIVRATNSHRSSRLRRVSGSASSTRWAL